MLLLPALLLLATQDTLVRVHDALFLRTAPDAKSFGAEELDPLLYSGSRWLLEPPHAQPLLVALDALHASDLGARSVREKLVLQRDLWAAYDWVEEFQPEGTLAAALARALRELGSPAEALRALRTDPAGVEGLPAGVLDATQGWVHVVDARGRTITPAHESFTRGRSYFDVLFRLPGGREETLAYLERLRALPDPLQGPEEDRRFRADIPQMPAGTAVALVRRALGIDEHGEPVPTQLVESVQLRRFESLEQQSMHEFRIDRSGKHTLREMTADEFDFSSFGSHGDDPFDATREGWSAHKPGLLRCVGCHGHPGIYSINSFTRLATGPGTILIVNPHDMPSVLVEAPSKRDETLILDSARTDLESLRKRWDAKPR